MLLFEQLDLFTRIAGDAVRAPRFFRGKNRELASKSGKLTALPAMSPGDVELESKARDILESVGAFELAALVRVEWNPRLRSAAGRAHFEEQLISLNPRLREHGTAEIDRTLRHELAHLLAHARAGRHRISPHGVEWQRACADIGLAGEARCHTLPFPTQARARRLLYRCPHCGRDFPRVRRLRRAVACLACCCRHNHGRFDPRFRLKLVRQIRV